MWRDHGFHKQSDTEYLDAAIERLDHDPHLRAHARALMHGASQAESLIADSFRTPQDIRFHAEGPWVGDHIERMLVVLFAIVEEKLHLIDIEELRRLTGYEGEIDEMEEMIKEYASFYEVMALFHDVTKWISVTFSSRPGSRGEALGFNTTRQDHHESSVHHRAEQREKYVQLFEAFVAEHAHVDAREIQSMFFLSYEIEVHYPHHARRIFTPVYQQLLSRLCVAHGLTERDQKMIEDIVSHHFSFLKSFSHVHPAAHDRLILLAQKRGYDADDFVDLLQGHIFLDNVCASMRRSAHGGWHDASMIVHALQSEHTARPERRVEKQTWWDEQEKQRKLQAMKRVGLDGTALMDLLEMEPGPAFGSVLRQVHAALLGQGKMPRFNKQIETELSIRAERFYESIFDKGE